MQCPDLGCGGDERPRLAGAGGRSSGARIADEDPVMHGLAHDLGQPVVQRLDMGRRGAFVLQFGCPGADVGRTHHSEPPSADVRRDLRQMHLGSAHCPCAPGAVAGQPGVTPLPDRDLGRLRVRPRPGDERRGLLLEPPLSIGLPREVPGVLLTRRVTEAWSGKCHRVCGRCWPCRSPLFAAQFPLSIAERLLLQWVWRGSGDIAGRVPEDGLRDSAEPSDSGAAVLPAWPGPGVGLCPGCEGSRPTE